MVKQVSIEHLSRLTVSPERHWSRYPSVILDRNGNYCASWYRYPPPDSGSPCQIYFCRGADRLDSIAALDPVQVTSDERNHTGETLCQDGNGNYHLCWHCWPQRQGMRYLLLSHSPDGKTWSTPIQPLPQIEEYMLYPSLVWHPLGRFWLTFSAGLGPGSSFYLASRVYLTSSPDGKAWEAPVMLSAGKASDNKSTLAIAPTGELVMVWRHLEGEAYGLRWSSSADGHRWREPKTIPVACAAVDRPKLSADNAGRIWLCYEGDGRIWACWRDAAQGWSQPLAIQTGAVVESRPSAPVQNRAGAFWMAWTSQRNGTEVWSARVLLD
jgi:hypothetical protein